MRVCIFLLYINLVVTTHAALLPPELYWKCMLPNAPIPKSIAVLLDPAERGREGRRCHTYCYPPPNKAIFFLEKDLKSGHKMNLPLENTSNQASFLPRQVVKFIPFSSSKLAEILNKFGLTPGSIEAEDMKKTIEQGEDSVIKGDDDKYCATSLESMIDFAILKLGKHVEALSTEVMMKNKKETNKQEYRIMNGVKKAGEANLVVCHKLSYVYAVFYCQKIEKTIAYTMSSEGADGSRVKAVSVCHRDTLAWDPKHLAIQMLNVKPGSVPICHILLQDTIAWLPKQK